MNDFLFTLAERQHLTPPDNRHPRCCPICGSLDISKDGTCYQCGTPAEIELEVKINENPFCSENRDQNLLPL